MQAKDLEIQLLKRQLEEAHHLNTRQQLQQSAADKELMAKMLRARNAAQ